jgi:hypothetical protein
MQKGVDFLNPAHGITTGMAHPEFIECNETGRYYLLEMNGRVGGGGLPGIDSAVYDLSQLELRLLELFDPRRFEAGFASFPRARKKSGFMFIATSPGEGVWNPDALEALKAHPSYFIPADHYRIPSGGKVARTTGMDSAQGIFFFVGDRETVRDGVSRTVYSFTVGSLPLVKFSSCNDALTARRQVDLRGKMHEGLRSIQWDRF